MLLLKYFAEIWLVRERIRYCVEELGQRFLAVKVTGFNFIKTNSFAYDKVRLHLLMVAHIYYVPGAAKYCRKFAGTR